MNRVMWANKATQANVDTLISRGIRILGPGSGNQACGEIGEGTHVGTACSSPKACWSRRLNAGLLAGLNVLITAGPTRERLDPVRYLTNRSSGKMGFAVAAAAREAGAHVTIVSGPVQLPTPAGVTRINVESARDMYAAVHRQVADADVFIAAAAVADFQPVTVAKQKIKKQGVAVKLDLEPAPDIIKSVADMAKRPFVVGFAAETNDVEENARSKLKRKKLDMIAANQVGDGIAFDCDDNALTVIWPGGKVEVARGPKIDVARAAHCPDRAAACRRPTAVPRRGVAQAPHRGRAAARSGARPPRAALTCAAHRQAADSRSAHRPGIPAAPARDPRLGGHGFACLHRCAARFSHPGGAELIPTGHLDLHCGPRPGGGAAAALRAWAIRTASCSAIWWA